MPSNPRAWRAEMYNGPHVSVWFVLLALILVLAAAACCVDATRASERFIHRAAEPHRTAPSPLLIEPPPVPANHRRLHAL